MKFVGFVMLLLPLALVVGLAFWATVKCWACKRDRCWC